MAAEPSEWRCVRVLVPRRYWAFLVGWAGAKPPIVEVWMRSDAARNVTHLAPYRYASRVVTVANALLMGCSYFDMWLMMERKLADG